MSVLVLLAEDTTKKVLGSKFGETPSSNGDGKSMFEYLGTVRFDA